MSIFTQVVSKLFWLALCIFFHSPNCVHDKNTQWSSVRFQKYQVFMFTIRNLNSMIWVSIVIRLPILNLPGALNYKHNINKLIKDLFFFSCNTPCISQDLCLYYHFRFVQLMSNYMYTCGSGIFCLKLSFSSSLSSLCLQWIS